MKIAFLASGNLGFSSMEAIADHYNPSLIATDSKSEGIIKYALKKGIPLFKGNPREGRLSQFALGSRFDLILSVNYLFILEPDVIDLSKYAINIHGSLLPKYRGRTPHVWAIINNEKETGVTIMIMDKGMDSGPILSQKAVEILPDETYIELDAKMAQIASQLLLDTVPKYIADEIKPQTQNETEITFCKKLDRDDGKIDWKKSTTEIYNQYRAFTPWPGVWTTWNNKRLKFLAIKPTDKKIEAGQVCIENDIIYAGTADSSIIISKLQLEGKPEMDAQVFINGYGKQIDKVVLSS